ncbi:DHA2 family efflux MFS transporter permease subunit [Sphingobacterium siyangense]|uniref:DHA2 family multidrug resistance protein n=1 Tax=Sphingobacterium siyangense TaxID=459529 RepID=A0A562MGX7_9SPHI|nr:DHA2 family efflux MFS transporter permease subunit [Sphingobacterium siyangense]TWI19149.1 DHA2 family multidrug resistance protein [Sphingobacterium siyangense]
MSQFKRQLLIFTVIIAAIMELIDTSIVNVALSYMSGNLGSTLEDTSWVITSYAIANVIVIPMTSFLTSKLGRRIYYIGSIILFTFCSFMCGQANSIWMLVFFRFLQGLGGGALLSVSQAVVFELFPKEKQGIAGALFGMGVFIGPTIGPTLGGYLTEVYSWPWIFFINIPIGIAAAVSSYYLLTEPKEKTIVKKVDWTGIALLAIGVGTLQTVLERGETEDWFATPYILWFTVISVMSLTAFIIWELSIENPVVNLRVLKSKTLSIAAVLTFITGIGMFTSVYLTPIIAQRLLNFTPTQTGLLNLPGAIIALFGLMMSGQALQRGVSPVLIVTIGYILFIFFNWQMSTINFDSSSTQISVNLIYRALGMAFLTVPLTVLAVSSVSPKDIPQAAALNNMMRQLGGSFGISIVNTYSFRRTAVHRTDLISHITPDNILYVNRINSYTAYFQEKGAGYIDAHQKALGLMEKVVVKQSTMLGYIDSFLLIAVLFACSLPLLLFVIKRKKGQPMPMIISDH